MNNQKTKNRFANVDYGAFDEKEKKVITQKDLDSAVNDVATSIANKLKNKKSGRSKNRFANVDYGAFKKK